MVPMIPSNFSASISSFEAHAPSVPRTRSQWKAALQGLKLLYAQRQYKQCAARSTELLKSATGPIHPVHECYLHFYSAISYEVLGEVAHKYSKNKLPLLRAALDGFLACSAALPATIPVPDLVQDEGPAPSPETLGDLSTPPESDSSDGFSTGKSSLLSSITRVIDRSIEFPEEDDPFISENEDCTDPVPFKLPPGNSEKAHLMPSPLQIRKPSSVFEAAQLSPSEADEIPKPVPSTRANQTGRALRPPPLPIKIVPTEEFTGFIPRQRIVSDGLPNFALSSDMAAVKRSETTEQVTFSDKRSIFRYNGGIQFLRSRVGSSIGDIQALIDEVTEVQRTRRASKTIRRSGSFWSFSPVKDQYCQGENGSRNCSDSGLEAKEQRIARLRAEGWNTVGVKSGRGWKGEEYYREYCSTVLDEMYCTG